MKKIGFFHKINDSLIATTVKKLLQRGDSEIFLRILWKLVHSSKICFTVSGRAQKVHVGWSPPESKYKCVRQQ